MSILFSSYFLSVKIGEEVKIATFCRFMCSVVQNKRMEVLVFGLGGGSNKNTCALVSSLEMINRWLSFTRHSCMLWKAAFRA